MNFIRGNCIGQGSFGTVNIAVDKSDGHLFAVKSVRMTSFSSAQLEALENEIRILKSLSSPFIVDYLGDDISNESATTTVTYRNLRMEYMPGGTAADLAKLPAGADVDEGIIKSVTSCIVSALAHIHSLGIVHCDVKGRNVLLGPTPGVAKMADFGSAATWTEEGVRPRGSPLWMAPEVVRGEYQGPESDVWSLGCTVIEMVTGKPAWEDKGYDTLRRIGYGDELPRLPNTLCELGKDFLTKCLRQNYWERWSCEQLLQHPFLVSRGRFHTVSVWSPRCVLDRFDYQRSSDYDFVNIDGKGRIRKLASTSRAIWEESDGWVAVRTMGSDVSASGACSTGCGEEERGGINLEYPEISDEITGEYSDCNMMGELCVRVNWESYENNMLPNYAGFVNYFRAGVMESQPGAACRYGSQKYNYSCFNLIFLRFCLCCCYYCYDDYKCNCRSYMRIFYFITCILYWVSLAICHQYFTLCCLPEKNKVIFSFVVR